MHKSCSECAVVSVETERGAAFVFADNGQSEMPKDALRFPVGFVGKGFDRFRLFGQDRKQIDVKRTKKPCTLYRRQELDLLHFERGFGQTEHEKADKYGYLS